MSGALPQSWRRVPLKHVARINERELEEQTDPEYSFRYVDIATVGRGRLVDEPRPMLFGKAPSRARRLVRKGDTLVSTVRTYLRATWTVDQPADDLVASTGFAIVSPTEEVDSRFLSWWLQSDDFIEDVVARSVGVSYPAISPNEIALLGAPLPSRSEQRAIADFLDRETARIDALIGRKQELSSLIDERVRAAAQDVLQAQQTEPQKLRHFTVKIGSGKTPRGGAEAYVPDGVLFLRSQNILMGRIYLMDVARIPPEVDEEMAGTRVIPNDVLLNITGGSLGRVAPVPSTFEPANVSQHVCIVRPNSRVVPRLLYYALRTHFVQDQIRNMQVGSNRDQLNFEQVGQLRVLLPLDTRRQQQAVEVLDRMERWSSRCHRSLTTQVQLLQEHRQALITAAVTGQMEVLSAA